MNVWIYGMILSSRDLQPFPLDANSGRVIVEIAEIGKPTSFYYITHAEWEQQGGE